MDAQTTLNFDTEKKSIRQMVLDILSDGEWYASFEIQNELKRRGQYAGEQTITSKTRDLRKSRYGSHNIECKWHGKVFKYRLVV